MLTWVAVRMSFPKACGLEPVALRRAPAARAPTPVGSVRVVIGVPVSVNSWGSSSLGSVLSSERTID